MEDLESKSSFGNRPFLSIVVPVFNEQDSLSPLYMKISEVGRSLAKPFEVVFVDDGSDDKTQDVLTSLHSKDGRVKIVRFRRNCGQTAAMAA